MTVSTAAFSPIKGLVRRLPRDGAAWKQAAAALLHARHLCAYHWAVPYVAGRRVVEIGVNRGYGTRLLATETRAFLGIDLSFEHVQFTRHATGRSVLQADGQRLPLRAESVDVVVTFQVIEHVWNDRAYLNEIHRVLRPGGLLLASTPQAIRRLLPRQIPWNREHLREYDEVSWNRCLKEVFAGVSVFGLFGDDEAMQIEQIRIAQDPWRHFFGGPWGGPVRVLGRTSGALLGRLLPFPSPRASTPQVSDDDKRLIERFYLDHEHLDSALDLFAICEKGDASALADSFDPVSFWRERLAGSPTLEHTGTTGAPLAWQRWLYRGKARAYRRLLRRAGMTLRGRQVLDFGCGIGVFEDEWERLGARRADGLDVVPELVHRLQQEHPQRIYHCADLATADENTLGCFGAPDLITAIDVLYHLVDDDRLVRTLRRLSAILPSGGAFLFTDALHEQRSASHVRFRSLNHWLQILEQVGLRYVDREPVFALNNRHPRGVHRAPNLLGAAQHFLDIPVLRTMPWLANNWAVLAQR